MPRKRKRRAWGSITEKARQKHIIRWTENTPDGRKRLTHTFYGTAREAELWLARKRVECADKHDAPAPTVRTAYERWFLPNLERRLSEGKISQHTFDQYRRTWRYISERWGKIPVNCVRPADIQEWLDTLSKGDAREAVAIMRKLFDLCVSFDVLETNKLRAVSFELPAARVKRSKDVLTLTEAQTLAETLRGSLCEPAYLIAAFAGARTGEALGVCADDVEPVTAHGLTLALVRITKSINYKGEPAPLKNAQSERVAIMPPPYSERLLELVKLRRKEGARWLTHKGDGMPLARGSFSFAWRRDAGALAVPFSNLRNSWRTFAQYVWRIDYTTLEILMGHKLEGVTGSHYLRPTTENLVDMFARDFARFWQS